MLKYEGSADSVAEAEALRRRLSIYPSGMSPADAERVASVVGGLLGLVGQLREELGRERARAGVLQSLRGVR